MSGKPVKGSSPGPLLVVGLDMGDGPCIQHWARRGELPTLAGLIDSGLWLELESTAEVLHTSSWPTFATGVLPGKHGVYYPFQPKPGRQGAEHINPDQYAAPTFWAAADEQGRRCLVYDVPETFPEPGFGGRGIFEWGTWAWYGEQKSQPESLLAELRSRFGPYPLKLEATRLGLKFPAPAMLERRLLKSIEHKTESLKWLLSDEPWDLAVVAYCETHPAGHYLWPANAATAADVSGPALRIYQALDRALAELKASLAPEATLMIVSGDGVRANHCGWHLLPEVLERLGYTRPLSASDEGDGGGGGRSLSLRSIKAMVPPGARRWIADHLPGSLRERISASMEVPIDWAHSRAFTLPTDLEGCIRLNVRGREPEGIVDPGREYQDLCDEISTALQELVNPATGEPAVEKVWIRNEIYPGPAQDDLPDLVVSWNGNGPISALTSARIGTVAGPSPDPRTGTHSTRGFLLMHGEGIPAGAGQGRLVDVAPTALNLLGISAGDAMDGRSAELGAPTPGPAEQVAR